VEVGGVRDHHQQGGGATGRMQAPHLHHQGDGNSHGESRAQGRVRHQDGAGDADQG
jgi:hypothetical protein